MYLRVPHWHGSTLSLFLFFKFNFEVSNNFNFEVSNNFNLKLKPEPY